MSLCPYVNKNKQLKNLDEESVLHPDLKPEEQDLIIKLIKQHFDIVQQKF